MASVDGPWWFEGRDVWFGAVLFTDIEDSTPLWERHRDVMAAALQRHHQLIESAVAEAGGMIIKNTGDGFVGLFPDPASAVAAGIEAQSGLAATAWGLGADRIAVRMAIDAGEIEHRDHDIAGPPVNRCSRMMDVAHGDQILVSDSVADRLDSELSVTDLGAFSLKGISEPVGIHLVNTPTNRHVAAQEPGGLGWAVRGFDLRERIGAGIAGVVYRAHQRSVGREVAIKLIRPEYANDRRFVHRFETEAQFIARLEHPHIVSLYDYWRDPDGAYLVMRWLRGGSLRQALDGGPWDEPSAVRLLRQIGSALSYAHRHGVIHRDVRPSNVLLDEERNGYLSDFGIASRPITVDGLSASSSPGYRSPEETAGDPLTPASDQYCLALLAHEILTGRTPDLGFEVELANVATAPVEQAITRATAPDPSDRFPDVDSFLAALEPEGADGGIVTDVSRDPFKGLQPFLESDAADFAGRDELVARLIDAVAEHRLVTAVGASGSGKSSAVRAGLVPALRSGSLPGSQGWLITDMYPGARPFDELASALLSVATEPFPDLVGHLRQVPGGLAGAVERITPADSELVLVIDQFEELFTLSDEATQRSFVEALVGLVSAADTRARVILTLRADFYDRPLGFSQFAPLLDRGLVTIGAPSAQELTKAITEPSENVGLVVEPALVELIVDQVVDQPGGLPLLQYTLSELFGRRDHNRLTIDAFHEIGGVTGALGSRADALFSGLDSDGRSAAEQVFLRLVSLDDTGEPTRRRVLASELGDSPSVQAVLETYGASRLLTFDRDPVTRDPTVEVAHEALLQGWPRLAGWIDHRRDDLVTHRRFSLARGEWDNRDRDHAYLLSGPRLAHFETWAGDTLLALTESERAFLTLSRTEENRLQARRHRIRRLVTAGFAVVALVASLFAVVALVQRNRAEENELAAEQARIEAEANAEEALRQQGIAEGQTKIADENAEEARQAEQLARSRELAAAAIATIDEDPQLSILLALEAADMADPPPASIEALHQAVQSQQLIHEIEIRGPFWAEWSLHPDGRHIAITNDAISIEVIDIESDSIVSTYSIPEGSLVELAGSTPAKNRALESEAQPTPEAECRNIFGAMSMQAVAFSPDGSLVATVLGDGRLHVFDAFTATPVDLGAPQFIQSFDAYCYPYATVDFTSDGSGVIVAVKSIDELQWPDWYQYTQIWAVDGSGLIAELPVVFSGASVDVSPDERWAVTPTFWDRGIAIDDLGERQGRREAKTGTEVTFDALFVPEDMPIAGTVSEGPRVITARRSNMAQVWDVDAAEQIGWFEGPETTIDLSPTGTLVGAGFDGTIYVWDLASGLPIATLVGHDGVVWDVEISDDGMRVASGPDGQGRIKVWDIGGASQAEVAGILAPGRRTTRIDATEDTLAVLTRNGVVDPGSLMLYAPESLDLIAEVPDQFGFGLRLTKDGRIISQVSVFGGEGWSDPLETDVVIRSISDPNDVDRSIPTRTLCNSAPDIVHDEGLGCSEYWVFPHDVDTDGRFVAIAGSDAASLWDMDTETLVAYWTFGEGYLNGVRFSPDASLLVVGSGFTARVYETGAWQEPIALLSGFDYTVNHMDFSPDGSLLAVQASESNHLTVWKTETWELAFEHRDHQGGLTDLDFSPDGRWLVTVGIDGFARVYDAENGEATSLVPTPGDGERYVRFAPSNPNHLIVASENGVVSILTLDHEELIEIARNKLFRGFTASECERFALDACDEER